MIKNDSPRSRLGLVRITIIFISLSLVLSGCSSGSSGYDESDYEDAYEEDDFVTSDSWDCTDDCGGHDAGYEWAADNGITDSNDCDGNSNSFIEGCEAYANEYQMENREEEYFEDDYYYEY